MPLNGTGLGRESVKSIFSALEEVENTIIITK